MPPKGSLRDRVAELEQQLQAVRAVADELHGRDATQETPRSIRLAKTTTSGTYPTSGQKFEIVFVGATYTAAVGMETLTPDDRSASPQDWVYNLTGTFLGENTLIWVFEFAGQWWTVTGGAGGTLYGFELTADLAATDATGTGDITDTWVGDTPTDTTDVTLHNQELATSGQYLFAGTTGRRGFCVKTNSSLWSGSDPEYVIVQLECLDSAAADGKIKMDSGDTFGYLPSKWDNDGAGTYNATNDVLVEFEHLTATDTFRAWVPRAASGSDELVKATSSDPTAGYLTDKLGQKVSPGSNVTPVYFYENGVSEIRAYVNDADLPVDEDKYVAVDTGLTPGYLIDQFANNSGTMGGGDQLVYFEVVSGAIRAYTAQQPAGTDEKTKAHSGDTAAGYLDSCLANSGTMGAGDQLVYWQVDGEQLKLFTAAQAAGTDKLVAVSVTDTPGYLEDQLSPVDSPGGPAVTVHFSSDGSVITAWFLESDLPSGFTDKYVAVSGTDTPGYLEGQFSPVDTPTGNTITVHFTSDGSVMGGYIAEADLPTDSDEKVRATSSDPTAGTLYSKIADHGTFSGVDYPVLADSSPGSTVRLFVDSASIPAGSDEHVKVSVTDVAGAGYLEDKMDIGPIGTTAVKFQSDGNKIYATVNIPPYTDNDEKVKASGSDGTAGYLNAKLLPSGTPVGGDITVRFVDYNTYLGAYIAAADLPANSDRLVAASAADGAPGELTAKLSPFATQTEAQLVNFQNPSAGLISATWSAAQYPGYSSTPGVKQVLLNDGGSISWVTLEEKTFIENVDFVVGSGFMLWEATALMLNYTSLGSRVWEPGGPC